MVFICIFRVARAPHKVPSGAPERGSYMVLRHSRGKQVRGTLLRQQREEDLGELWRVKGLDESGTGGGGGVLDPVY